MSKILIIAAPRFGSTLFCNMLRRKKVESLFEIFHANPDTLSEYLGKYEAALLKDLNIEGRINRNFVKENHIKIFNFLDGYTKNSFSIKIFPNQVNQDTLESCIKYFDYVIFLGRNLIDSHISNIIAKQIGKWGGISNEDKKVNFNAASFLMESLDIFYHFNLSKIISEKYEKPVIYLNYETLSKDSEILYEVLGIRNIEDDLEVPFPKRQDSRTSSIEKVNNPYELYSFMKSRNLDKYLDSSTVFNAEDFQSILKL